ncbi:MULTISPECIES: DUF2147 domain-containing protein [Aureimonas]|uniref:DUF2147 domain-containing protein n=1 Tax=Aureimonas ureilytica TaxID=401562 RepID=A0A175R5I1_9HYPH|nr:MULTISPECIES: DUF2147 domain-containing protein [Aureimonas]KTQ85317.1 hypothetical protein NS226_20025 [Aureimonas ureilytica]
MPKLFFLACLASPFMALPAMAEPILGTWRLSNGETVTYSRCGASFCSRVETGRYQGRSVGRMDGGAPTYTGTVIDPRDGKSYDGRAEVKGDKLVLTGCVARIFCRSQTWSRHRGG